MYYVLVSIARIDIECADMSMGVYTQTVQSEIYVVSRVVIVG